MVHFEIRVLRGQDRQVFNGIAKLPVSIVGGGKHLIVAGSPSVEQTLIQNLGKFAEIHRL